MSKETFPHLEALRDLMRSKHIDAVIIPGTDPHQSEYPSEHWKFRDYVSGFTGSNGTAVVTLDDAGLWTDSTIFCKRLSNLRAQASRSARRISQVSPPCLNGSARCLTKMPWWVWTDDYFR